MIKNEITSIGNEQARVGVEANAIIKLRLDLENILLCLDREAPNVAMAIEIAKEQLERWHGPYKGYGPYRAG